jgi:hypothetical protein
MVRDIEGFTRADYVEALRSSLQQQGWPCEIADAEAAELLELVRFWPAGTVVERRLDVISVRVLAGHDNR